MPIYRPTELLFFLESRKLRPRKILSQNFLIDGNIIQKIIDTAALKQNDLVLEIGPGPGSLTEALLASGADVIAVEKDEKLATALMRLQGPLQVITADIIDCNIAALLKPYGRKAKVIANLPYHLTTPILAHLIQKRESITHLVVMVQEEVARRMTAQAGGADYSSLTLFLNFYSNLKYAFKVKRNCFMPAPKVDSAVVVLTLKEPFPLDEESFFKMTRTAFQQRRKTLKVSLSSLYPTEAITYALKALDISPLARPQELTPQQFIALFQRLV